MLTVSSIAHVAIRVKDVPRTLDFYVGKLGMREMMRLDRDGSLWLLYVCLEVADIDVAARELEAAGVPLIRGKQMGADGNWQAWIEDPDGHRIELMQMMRPRR